MRSGLLLAVIGLACGGEPPPQCPSPLPSQVTADSMKPLFWLEGEDCIQISYHPAFRDREQELGDAVMQWTGSECGRICFSAPVERATPEDGRPLLFTIHIAPLLDGLARESRTAVTYRETTGQIDRALVEIDPALSSPIFRRAVLRGMGRALGFDEPPAERASILHPLSDQTELSSFDLTGYCSKYGVCGDPAAVY